MKVVLAAVLLSAAMIAAPAAAATYRGVAKDPGVIWISTAGPAPAAVPAEPAIHQTMKAFVPSLLVVSAGGTVRFPNDDEFYHSVYSVSPSNPFDLGLYDTGPGKSVEFDNPGIVEVRCHVHGSMHATVVVVDGPSATLTQPHQAYRLDGLTRGPHVLHVWTDGLTYTSTAIVVK